MLRKIILALFVFSTFFAFAQNKEKVWIFFSDKNNTSFNPFEYFDAKAIERRIKHGINLYDSSDFPVNESYLQKINELGFEEKIISRWFNAAIGFADHTTIEKIKLFPFVKEVVIYSSNAVLASIDVETSDKRELSEADTRLLFQQCDRMNANYFWDNGFTGKGIRIAIFDAGFPNVDKIPVFEHIRKANRIINTYDFVRKKDFVYGYAAHGTNVLSCIAGLYDGKRLGLATDAEFLLARTEIGWREPFSEEENWLAAAEWADKNGAQIINSSLGYTHHRYFVSDMDGKKSFVARAANMAASKGILVVNAAGNEGNGKWKYIGTPADADSVLSVGAIEPNTDRKAGFSSFGPTADKRLKPNVTAYGHVIAEGKNGFTKTQGTSFASPLVAGFAACALQTKPNLKNMELFEEIKRSATLYPYFDYVHGYGIPQANYFTNNGKPETEPTFNVIDEGLYIKVYLKKEFMKTLPDKPYVREYFYYHVENPSGYLEKYAVLKVENEEVLQLFKNDFDKGSTARFHYKGYTYSIQINN
jgi:subtilisin family serine protease